MGKGAVQDKQADERPADAGAARATVMAAARAVAQRDGVENLTLGKVATETGLQRSLVYRQFARKEDLLMSIVSEDLAALARSLHDMDWSKGGDTPESAVILSLPRAADAPATELPATETPASEAPIADVPLAVSLNEDAPTPPSAPLDETPAPRQRLTRRADLAQLLETKTATEEVDMKAAETPRSPDAWLERRLRTFERSVSGLEARQDQVEKNARAAAMAADESIKALQATVEELRARADAAEARQKAASVEVRTALNEAALRIQTVEGVARAALAENGPAEPTPAVESPQPEVEASEPAPTPAAVDEALADAAPKSFIADVRKSVVAASAAAAAQADAEVAGKARKSRKSMVRYLLGGLAVLVIFIAAAGMAFSKGVNDGRRDALTQVARVNEQPLAPRQTPLDQLTARARSGDPAAELQVALRYLNATPKNTAEAIRWTTLAAIHGQPVAQYLLATLYAQSSPPDATKALQWYEAAALQGNRKAMHALAVAYAEGLGTAKSPSEAARWFSRAAGFGYVDSEFNLAVLYERGDGVPQSLLDAYKWYAVAGRQGDVESKARIEALRTQLNGDDLAAAQHAADAFRAMPLDVAANTAP